MGEGMCKEALLSRGLGVGALYLFLLLLLSCNQPTKNQAQVEVSYGDADGDGFYNDVDCDDENALIHPEAQELCNDRDDNCNGQTDENPADGSPFYIDADGDGYGDSESVVYSCSQPEGYIANSGDCDDSSAQLSPDRAEVCDGIDNDCDGLWDDEDPDAALLLFYLDADGDGWGDEETAVEACLPPNENYVSQSGDCNDNQQAVYPGGEEVCDGLDNDCDGFFDSEDPDSTARVYADADGDGYGDPDLWIRSCETQSGYVANDDDCDDSSAAVFPEAIEICDGIDNNCNGAVDDDDALVDVSQGGQQFFPDADGDGYGDPEGELIACSAPSGYVSTPGDCNDSESEQHPGWDEICDDGIENNCTGGADCDDPYCGSDPACAEVFCADGQDDEGDGLIDCLDQDCQGSPDCGEPSPLCSDAVDNDGDGFTDCDDSECFLFHGCAAPTCPNFDLGSAVAQGLASGSTVNATNSVDPACGAFSGTGNDFSFAWKSPEDGCVTFDTLGSNYDTVLAIYSSCASVSSSGYLTGGCDDDIGSVKQSSVSCNLSQGDEVVIVVDGYNGEGVYELNTSIDIGNPCSCTTLCCNN